MKISQRLFDMIPNLSVNNKGRLKVLNKIGDYMGRPFENRLIMGATAIVTQPFIDEHNKRVDKETARTSRNRTIGKIIAGTTVGCIVRSSIYKLIQKTTAEDISIDRWDNFLTPRGSSKVSPHLQKNMLRNYRTAVSTVIAMLVMIETNILFDVPFTNKISNYLNKKDAKKKAAELENKTYNNQSYSTRTNLENKFKDKFNISSGGVL